LISLSKERRHAVENLLNRLAGVRSARVEISETGEVEGIHVVSTGRFSPAQQARNIESALLATLNLELDPRLIRVVSLKEGEAQEAAVREGEDPPPGKPREQRVRLQQIVYEQVGFKITAHVELAWQGRILRGSAEDTDTAKGRMVAAARATLNALEELTERRVAFFLEGVEHHETFERTLAVASLRVISDQRKADLVGCSIVDEDPHYAAAQAVLGAVNRSFVRLLVTTGADGNGINPQRPTVKGEARERYALS
jgi:hypothetical protein